MILDISWTLFIFYIWFETDFTISYSKLFGFYEKFKIKEYDEWRITHPRVDYFDFLRIKYPSFIVKLITCKHCLLFWISLYIVILSNNLYELPIVYMVTYILYKIIKKI